MLVLCVAAMLDIFSEELECPRVFVDADAVSNIDMVTFTVMNYSCGRCS